MMLKRAYKYLFLFLLPFGVISPAHAQEILHLQKNQTIGNGQQAQKQKERLAHYYYLNHDYEKAAQLFGELFKKKPNNYYYTYYLNSLIFLKDYKEAAALTKKQSKKYSSNYRYQVDYAYVLEQAGNTKKSKKVIQKLINRVPRNRADVINLANALQSKGYAREAIVVYEKAMSMPGNSYSYNLERANAYRLAGDYDKMFDAYLNYLKNNPGNGQLVKNRLQFTLNYDVDNNLSGLLKKKLLVKVQKHPDNFAYNDLLLWLSMQTGDFETALRQAKAIDRRFGGHEEEVYNLARIALSNGKTEIAGKAFEYLKKKGENGDYYIEGYAGWLKTKIKVAEAGYPADIEMLKILDKEGDKFLDEAGINKETAETVKELAEVKAFYLNRPHEAEALLNRALETPSLNPKQKAEVKMLLAGVLFFENKSWDASLLYSQVELDMKNEPIGHLAKYKNALLFYYMGEYQWAKARLDILKAATSKLIANDALEMSLFIKEVLDEDTLGFTLKIFGAADRFLAWHKPDSALVWLQKIEDDAPGPVSLQFVLFKKGAVYEQLRRYREADSVYTNLVTLYPGSIKADDALFAAAKIEEEYLGLPDEAAKKYLQIMKSYPESVFSAEARKRYRKIKGEIKETEDGAS